MASGGPKYPQPTAEERRLQSEQALLLAQQRDLLQEQMRRQELLAPLLYKSAGIIPQYGPDGQLTGFEQGQPSAEEQLFQQQLHLQGQQLQEQQLLRPYIFEQMGLRPQYDADGNLTGFSQFTTPEQKYFQEQMTQGREQLRQQGLLQPLLYSAMGLLPQYDASGKLTGFERDPAMVTQEQQGREITSRLNERTLQALEGKLPVDPALERSLTEQEATLRNTLLQQLGPGYETSSPGSQRLADFAKRGEELRYGARTGQLALGEQLSLAREGSGRRGTGQTIGDTLGVAGLGNPGAYYMPGSATGSLQQTLGAFNPVNFYTPGSSGSMAARYTGSVGYPFEGAGQLGQLASLYQSAQQPYAQQRNFEYQNALRQAQTKGGFFGSLFGGVGGLLFGPSGAGMGQNLGQYLGYAYF